MEKRERYHILDMLRAISIISMVIYHICWDLVNLFAVEWAWFRSPAAYVWQQYTCWSFILLSGFCWSMSRTPLKRGIIVFVSGGIVTITTLLFSYPSRIIFGILTFIGSAMLIMIPLEKLLKKVPALCGAAVSALMFFVTRNINRGSLGFEGIKICELPDFLYNGYFSTYIGFKFPTFFSRDYFSLFPWLFLFIFGYFLYRIASEKKILNILTKKAARPLCFIGRHSLEIYLAHQPIVYFAFILIFGGEKGAVV